jgi:hypothetical protein
MWFETAQKLPRCGMDLLVAVPTACNISSSIDGCKREKHMTLIKQYERFQKYFENVPSRNANDTFPKGILHARRQETQIAMTMQSGI